MPPRLSRTRSRLGDILIYDRGDADSADPQPIRLYFDTKRKDFAVIERSLPAEAGDPGGVQLSEWVWSNGQAGAGTSIETPESYAGGACEYGEFVWLRRRGVAQPAGELTELALPAGAASLTSGWPSKGQVFDNDLFISTRGRYLIQVPNATGAVTLTEVDLGVNGRGVGMAVFDGTGSACLYVGDVSRGIHEYDGTSWDEGDPGTERVHLAVPYWVLGDQLATGGLSGSAGFSDEFLVGTDPNGTGMYHVAGDPKDPAEWSALTKVGVGGTWFPIQSIIESNRVVWFGTGLGVLGVDGLGHTPNLTKWVEQIANTANGGCTAFWNGLIWFATVRGLSVFSPDGTRIDLDRSVQFGGMAGTTPIYGRPRALIGAPEGLYTIYYNAETDVSYVGILLLDPDGSYRWSMAEAVVPDVELTWVQQVTGTDGNPRLFMGGIQAGGTHRLFWQSLPKSGDPESDYRDNGPFRAAASWSLRLSRFNGGRAVQHTARRFMVEIDQVGTGFPQNSVAFTVANDGGSFVTQGTASQGAVRNGRWNAQPKIDTAQATSMQVKLDVTNTATEPVVIRTASVLYSSHPELSRVIQAPIVIGEGRGYDPRAMLQRLDRAQRAGPLAMKDYFGRSIEGTISVDRKVIDMEAEGNGFTAHVDITILVTRQVTRFDAGDLFDNGFLFS